MKRVYLDQCRFIDLRHAEEGRPRVAGHRDALDYLLFGVEKGLVSCPLSGMHYVETHRQRDWDKRSNLGRLMAKLSRRDTIAPNERILPGELDLALRKRFGRPISPRTVPIFGKGYAHASAGEVRPPRPPGVGKDLHRVDAVWDAAMEGVALIGLPHDPPNVTPQEPTRKEYVEGEERLASEFARVRDGLSRDDWKAGVHAKIALGEMIDMGSHLHAALMHAAIDPEDFMGLGIEGFAKFVADVPIKDVMSSRRRLRHENQQTKWVGNDLADLALAIPLVYCDILVCEKDFAHTSRRAGLDEKYGTVVLDDLIDLPSALV